MHSLAMRLRACAGAVKNSFIQFSCEIGCVLASARKTAPRLRSSRSADAMESIPRCLTGRQDCV